MIFITLLLLVLNLLFAENSFNLFVAGMLTTVLIRDIAELLF